MLLCSRQIRSGLGSYSVHCTSMLKDVGCSGLPFFFFYIYRSEGNPMLAAEVTDEKIF